MKRIELFGLRLPVVQKDDSIAELILKAVEKTPSLNLKDQDILIIASKAVSASQGRRIHLDSLQPSKNAQNLAAECGLEPAFVEVALREAEKILGCVPGAILTLSKGIVQANAGVDRSNTPPGTAILLPNAPDASAGEIRKTVYEKTGLKLAVIIGDSRTTPLRRGTSGIALGISGMGAVIDDRGKTDLFGNQLRITWRALADNCCSAAQLLMGESDEQVPVVLIRGVPIDASGSKERMISPEQCLFFGTALKDKLGEAE
ncbi:MAG: coenzyme F420-0:L-glutamate ligase [Candidatus Thorarchaeota archaeon]